MSTPIIILYQKLYSEYSVKYSGKVCIFLQVGKFYELYDIVDKTTGQGINTTKAAAERMNIVLKSDEVRGEIVLKAGLPEQSLHKFAQVLTQDGWTVVVIDQIKDIKGDVTSRIAARILSAGTHYETALADRMGIASLYITPGRFGASVVDITTGESFSYESNSSDDILHMFQVYSVREVIVKQTDIYRDENEIRSLFGIKCVLHLSDSSIPESYDSPVWREDYFRKVYNVKTLLPVIKALYLPDPRNTILEKALCIILQCIQDHFPQISAKLHTHSVHSPSMYVRVNNNMLEQLNFITTNKNSSILELVDKTYSSIGRRAMRERILRPITNTVELEKRWGDIDWILQKEKLLIESHLRGISDIPRIHNRISAGYITCNDALLLFQSYSHIECLLKELSEGPLSANTALTNYIRHYRKKFSECFDEKKCVASSQGGSHGYLTEHAGPKAFLIEGRINGIQALWRMKWGTFCIKNRIDSNVFTLHRYESGELYFEGPRNIKKQLDAAIANEDKENPQMPGLKYELKTSGPLIIQCNELTKLYGTCYELYHQHEKIFKEELIGVCDTLWELLRPFQHEWIEWIGRIDCSLSIAAVSRKLKWIRPTLSEESCLDIQGLRHPLLESFNTRCEYVKHNISLSSSTHGWLIYGVNASGKSSLMKATGIAVLLAQAGCYVPADTMKFRPYESTFSRIWSHDNIWAGLSSFAVEIGELRDIIEYSSERSLVLGDEVCSGTESISATSLVASTLEYLDKKGTHFMFATHLHDLLKVPGFLPTPGISVFHLSVIRTPEGKLIYDRKLKAGSGSATYGLEVAKAMGLPFSLMERAYEIRKGLGGEDSKKSIYNSNIFRESCEVCGNVISNELEVHHIEQQSEEGSNHVRNLTVLCEKCHDLHHNKSITVGPLQQTSDGYERKIEIKVNQTGPQNQRSRINKSQEEMDTIRSSLNQLKGRPFERIRADLKEKGIIIKKSELESISKAFM
jgi:DNA mismatch repair protein MutS